MNAGTICRKKLSLPFLLYWCHWGLYPNPSTQDNELIVLPLSYSQWPFFSSIKKHFAKIFFLIHFKKLWAYSIRHFYVVIARVGSSLPSSDLSQGLYLLQLVTILFLQSLIQHGRKLRRIFVIQNWALAMGPYRYSQARHQVDFSIGLTLWAALQRQLA